MGKETGIAWTDHTFNPWWGCEKVSRGCAHCYAETLSRRYQFNIWGAQAPRRFFSDKHWAEPVKWDKDAAAEGVQKKVFCASMADVFEYRKDLNKQRERLFRLIERTPNLIWQLLTKRPQYIIELTPKSWDTDWPENCWIGTSTEDQETYDARANYLRLTGAKVRFLSMEPLLGPITMTIPDGIQWAILGGESGPGARPCHVEWLRALVQQCEVKGIACFVKQLGAQPYERGVKAFETRKGDNPDEWPATFSNLKRFEFPSSKLI